MARNSVGTRKTPDLKGVAKVRQKDGGLPQGDANAKRAKAKRPEQRSQRVKLSPAKLEQMLALYAGSPLSVREIGRRYGVDGSRVTREAQKAGVERGDAVELATRVDLEGAKRIAEGHAGKRLVSTEQIQQAFVVATAKVLETQRADQREARAAVQALLVRLQSMMQAVPEVSELLHRLAALAQSIEDSDLRRSCFDALGALNIGDMAKTARQLVASLKDLDALERAAYGLKDVTSADGEQNKARPRAVVVPAKAELPNDDDDA